MIRKGIRNFCNGDGSTSTLNQEKPLSTMHVVSTYDDIEEDSDDSDEDLFMSSISSSNNKKKKKPQTLEEMILQLEMEEQISARKSVRNSNTDLLASARNQYPRFSLDGKDALYRSSFRNFEDHPTPARHSVCCDGRERLGSNYKKKLDHNYVKLGMPARLAGESVVWCNPGVIGKLMGLDAMPIPINNRFQRHNNKFDHRSGRPTMRRSMPLYSSNYRNRNCTINTRYSLI